MPAPRYVGALDQGTTSTRFAIFDPGARCVALAQRPHAQRYPAPGWVEHDPREILRRCDEVVSEAFEAAGLGVADLAAVGITNQRETVVAWNRVSAEPVANAIVWQDTRTREACDALIAGSPLGIDRFRAATGLPVATYFSGPKIAWLLDELDLTDAAEGGDVLVGTVDSWLIRHLTGRHVTDVTNASRTLLMNLHSLDWDPLLLSAIGVPRACLPDIRSSSEVYGEGTGVLAGVPVAAALGDQQAALFGQGCFTRGEAKNTYGTGCFLLAHTGDAPVASSAGLISTVAARLGAATATYALEGSVAMAGATVQWLRDSLGLIASAGEVEWLARRVPDNGGVYLVPAFSGLFAPYWRSDARGVIAGLTRYATAGHLARAALEATAYQTLEVVEAMAADGAGLAGPLKVDGGMVANDLLMQFQADLLEVPVVAPAFAETTVLGAAFAAGLAVGFWSSLGELQALWRPGKRWEPALPAAERARLLAGWKKAVERSMAWM